MATGITSSRRRLPLSALVFGSVPIETVCDLRLAGCGQRMLHTLQNFALRNWRGERGGYDLLRGRLISWVNPRFFLRWTDLDSKS